MSFAAGWAFSELHMPAVRAELVRLPAGYFMDFAAAEAKQDMEQATDLVLNIEGGTMAVRVRRNEFWKKADRYGPDWSIRYKSRGGGKTEIHKLQEGYCDWYFYGYSLDDAGALAAYWLIDLYRVREEGLLDREWQVWPNGDQSAGMYVPLAELEAAGCVLHNEVLDGVYVH